MEKVKKLSIETTGGNYAVLSPSQMDIVKEIKRHVEAGRTVTKITYK